MKTQDEPYTPPIPLPVLAYACSKCGGWHYEDTDAALFKAHLAWQTKQGRFSVFETMEQRRLRYGL